MEAINYDFSEGKGYFKFKAFILDDQENCVYAQLYDHNHWVDLRDDDKPERYEKINQAVNSAINKTEQRNKVLNNTQQQKLDRTNFDAANQQWCYIEVVDQYWPFIKIPRRSFE